MKDEIKLLDVVALTTDLLEYDLWRGEIGTVVECHSGNAFEVEFVAQDGYTLALVTLRAEQIIPIRIFMSLFLPRIPDFKGEGLVNHKCYNSRKIDFAWLIIKLYKVQIYDSIIISRNQTDFNRLEFRPNRVD